MGARDTNAAFSGSPLPISLSPPSLQFGLPLPQHLLSIINFCYPYLRAANDSVFWRDADVRYPSRNHWSHSMERTQNRAETLHALRQLCRGTDRQFVRASGEKNRLSTGLPALDSLLPDRGLEPGCLVEWLAPVEGCGTSLIALQGVRSALKRKPTWAVVDSRGEFYPPAAQGWGLSLETMLWLRPSSVADAAWAVEQCLRCPAVGITWFQADSLPDRVLQRWKIAAETGGGIGMLFRPAKVARSPSWADVRWLVHPRPAMKTGRRRVQVELISCRGECHRGASVELELCNATGDVRLVSSMASSTPAVRAARA